MIEIYRIPTPYSQGEIVVYGAAGMASFEWKIEANGQVLTDTIDRAYGCAEVALRDALIAATD
jgi:hypothetical protein